MGGDEPQIGRGACMTGVKLIAVIVIVLVIVGLILVVISRRVNGSAGGAPHRKKAALAKLGSWLAGTGALYGLLYYFLDVRGGSETTSVRVRLLVSAVCVVVGFVLMKVGQRAKKRASGAANRKADLAAEVGYWVLAAGCAYIVIHSLFGL